MQTDKELITKTLGLLSIFIQAFVMSQKIFKSFNILTLQTFSHISEQFPLNIFVTLGALSARLVRPPPILAHSCCCQSLSADRSRAADTHDRRGQDGSCDEPHQRPRKTARATAG